MAFDVAYSYTRELFPTSMRSTAMGVGSGFARIGSMISALIALLEDYRWVKVVVVVVVVDVRVFYHFQFFLLANLKGNLPKCELLHRLSPIKFPGIILLIMSAGNSVIFFFKKKTSSVLLPLFIYGALAFAAAVLGVWVWPETARLNLPNSMEEAERTAMTRNSWLFWKKKRTKTEEEEKVEQVLELFLCGASLVGALARMSV